jgi:REP element-mobilizing transposase RayT
MRVSNKDRSGFLFVSGSANRRIPLFRHPEACGIFLRTLDLYRQKSGFRVHAYVLMPEHYHLLLWLPPRGRFVDFLRDFKSFAGQRLIGWMREGGMGPLLARFEVRRRPQRRKDARHCVLQHGNYVKELAGERILWQKINYIHENPVRAGLVSRPEAYFYSSARTYAARKVGLVHVDVLD